LCTVLFHGQIGTGIVQCATDLEHLYRIYSIATHDKHQWLLLQFVVLLMIEAKGVRNMESISVVVNKHNTARVVFCWFIVYYSKLTNEINCNNLCKYPVVYLDDEARFVTNKQK